MGNFSIAEKLLRGASLSSAMVPSKETTENGVTHDETYRFPFIYLDGDRFFAQTPCTHKTVNDKDPLSSMNNNLFSLGYLDQMVMYTSDKISTLWGNIKERFNTFNWIVREDFEEVWNSDDKQCVDALRNAILNGSDLKLIITDEDGYTSILPVDLANVEQDSGEFIIRTEMGAIPSILAERYFILYDLNIITKCQLIPNALIPSHFPSVYVYFACYSDGTYYTYYDEPRSLLRKYKELKIFAKIDDAPEVHKISYEDAHAVFN